MQRYVVGGAVRDSLLGEPVHDRDWVVVGETPERMIAAGFQPVGRDFPVFLHPATNEEHALARTERKSGRGYRGFVVQAAPDVTLDEDLARRDLTINAMARDESGRIIDPYGGQQDLRDGVLRHVSPAFVEDPVRILRLARFAARWPAFHIAPETLALLRQMVEAGEVEALVPERVWQEFARGLMERRPSRMLEVLNACGALPKLIPVHRWHTGGLPAPWCGQANHAARLVDAAARRAASRAVRYALLALCLSEPADLSARWRVPSEERDFADLAGRETREALELAGVCVAADVRASTPVPRATAERVAHWLDRCDAWRRPERARALCALAGAAVEAMADSPDESLAADEVLARLEAALEAALAIDARAAAREAAARGEVGPAIGAKVLARRIEAIHTQSPLQSGVS
jgi:tRNA nucleotidyltransferase (CCA-adding enzyme)